MKTSCSGQDKGTRNCCAVPTEGQCCDFSSVTEPQIQLIQRNEQPPSLFATCGTTGRERSMFWLTVLNTNHVQKVVGQGTMVSLTFYELLLTFSPVSRWSLCCKAIFFIGTIFRLYHQMQEVESWFPQNVHILVPWNL